MKNILLLAHDDAGQEARFQAALDVVRAVGGHLSCLGVAEYPDLVDDGYGAAALAMEVERTQEHDNRTRLEQRLAVEGLPWDWTDTTGGLAPCLVEAAALADLIVLNRALDSGGGPDMRAVAAETLTSTAKPVLAVPERSRGFRVQGHAIIAWDGSSQSASALGHAVPLLRLAAKVTILSVDDGSIARSGEEAACYLDRHGISVTLRPRIGSLLGAAGELLKQIELVQPDYLVMGAFGNGRLKEALFGGVSRRLLGESPIPLLMAR